MKPTLNSRGGSSVVPALTTIITILMLGAVFVFVYTSFFGGRDSLKLSSESEPESKVAEVKKEKPKHLIAYAQKVEQTAQRNYTPPPDIAKAKNSKVIIQLRIARDGNPLGFELIESSEDSEIDRYIVKAILHQAYPAPTFKVDNNGVITEFTIVSRKVSVTIP